MRSASLVLSKIDVYSLNLYFIDECVELYFYLEFYALMWRRYVSGEAKM